MKRLLIFCLLVLPTLASAQKDKIHWMTMEEAEAACKTEPRLIMIDVYTPWCGPCKMMMANTFTDQEVIEYINEHYYAVKFNAEGPDPVTFKGTTYKNPKYDATRTGRNATHEFAGIANHNGKLAYPTLVFLDGELNLLTRVQGYQKPDMLMIIISWFGSDSYKTVTFENYQNSYGS